MGVVKLLTSREPGAEDLLHTLSLKLVGIGGLDHLGAKPHQLGACLVIALNGFCALVISVVKAQGDVLSLFGPHFIPDLLVPAVDAVVGHLAHQVLNGPDVLPTGHLLLRGQLFLAHGITSIRSAQGNFTCKLFLITLYLSTSLKSNAFSRAGHYMNVIDLRKKAPMECPLHRGRLALSKLSRCSSGCHTIH